MRRVTKNLPSGKNFVSDIQMTTLPGRRVTAVDRIILLKDVHMLILETCEYVTLNGKGDFADMMKLRISSGEIMLDFSGESSVITKSLISRMQEVREERRCYKGGYKDGGMDHK